ncbi:telomere-protecting terminal protein Tpg [Streptomyces actinomycinicus]|uniref:telomere-protecting terminal protein Tpg n=1 Tax=Streptomyces actinomycinicus TaxID=1695166 RepID=UPI001F282539|nr:hypothetical protein [Streptomyces actinomycinicus]
MERYVAGKFKRPRRDLRERMKREVKWWWQPQNRAKAKKRAASTGGLVVYTRARFGFTATPGTTNDARIRDITQALPLELADRSFTARGQGATEKQLQQIAAEGLAQMYFRANNARPRLGVGVHRHRGHRHRTVASGNVLASPSVTYGWRGQDAFRGDCSGRSA